MGCASTQSIVGVTQAAASALRLRALRTTPRNVVTSAALEGVRGFSTTRVPVSPEGVLQDAKVGDRVSVRKCGVLSEQMWCWGQV